MTLAIATMRVSSCTVVSTQIPHGGYVLANAITGAVDVVSPEMGTPLWEALCEGGRTGPWHVSPEQAADVVASLRDGERSHLLARGHLTTLPVASEQHLMSAIAHGTHKIEARQPVVAILPSLECNYRCTYCFERPLQRDLEVRSDTDKHEGVCMTQAHLEPLYAAIDDIVADGDVRRSRTLMLYGGEPLDRSNARLVTALVERGLQAGYTFQAVTNGHDLDHYLPLLGKRGIGTLYLTIDGPKHIHDGRRVVISGESSFDAITRNIQRILDTTDAELVLSMRLDPDNIAWAGETLRLFESLKWTANPRVTIGARPVYVTTADGSLHPALNESELLAHLRKVAVRYGRVASGRVAELVARMLKPVLESGSRLYANGTHCSANSGSYLFAPDGAIYACWRAPCERKCRVGTYMGPDGLCFDAETAERWFTRTAADIPACRSCAYALFCGGGCALHAERNNGELHSPNCNGFHFAFSQSLADEVEAYLDVGSRAGLLSLNAASNPFPWAHGMDQHS